MVVKRFDIYFASLDSTLGIEIQKTRPCLIISPDEMNDHLRTVIIAPLTSTIRKYPTRVDCVVEGKEGQIVLDQLRSIDKIRLTRRVGQLDSATAQQVLSLLRKMFA
ncbi:type II toxin-antitoxin system PemK/MazF family toxin [Dyadobacter sp. 50-39]|uniref:type II toxin-antitoxin system PemK/MazF family toxin n=1 Tax=Dyadobacter sp. 50-39 TaxID=1895756 RepID=UPI0025C297FF|nr:type II toxin-antitoxin system PemK/MazF family toxin [Dyadobacter sp. 50-39]